MPTFVVTPPRLVVFNPEQSAELVYLPNVVFRLCNRADPNRVWPYGTLLKRALSAPFGSVVSAGPARRRTIYCRALPTILCCYIRDIARAVVYTYDSTETDR